MQTLKLPKSYNELESEIKELSLEEMFHRLERLEDSGRINPLSDLEQKRKILLIRCIELCVEQFSDIGSILPAAEQKNRLNVSSMGIDDLIANISSSKDFFAACKKSSFFISKISLN